MPTEYDIAAAFEAIENELIASMMRNMKRHRAEEDAEGIRWSQWQAEQLQALAEYKRKHQAKYRKQFRSINRDIETMLREAKRQGGMEQEEAILRATRQGATLRPRETLDAAFFRVNERKLDALIKATTDDIRRAETAVLRRANDQYRKIIFNAQVYANTGAGTYEKAVDMAAKDFLSAGIQCVVYANGARHTLSDYAEMAIRTASKRAYLQGEGEKRQEWGISTVILNKRGNACPLCAPFCGKVFIDDVWSGGKAKDGPYPLLSGAIAKGLYHPRCKDSHTTFFPEISEEGSPWTAEEQKKLAQDYNREQKRQHAERQAKKFDRLAKYSLDEENKRRYDARARDWKTVCRDVTMPGEEVKTVPVPVEKPADFDIMKSGARITDTFSKEAIEFAEMYYKEIRSFSTDYQKIAKNLEKNETDIRKIKAYLFEDDSLFDPDTGEWRRFDPDCAIAQSWQRLMVGKDIKPHDRTLIEHELLEMEIKENNPGISHWKAHEMAASKYNYGKEASEYYGNLKKHQENK